MTVSLTDEPIAVDTNVIGWLFSRRPERLPYKPYLTGRQLVISFMTVAELRFGAEVAGWGQARRDRLEEILRCSSRRAAVIGHGHDSPASTRRNKPARQRVRRSLGSLPAPFAD